MLKKDVYMYKSNMFSFFSKSYFNILVFCSSVSHYFILGPDLFVCDDCFYLCTKSVRFQGKKRQFLENPASLNTPSPAELPDPSITLPSPSDAGAGVPPVAPSPPPVGPAVDPAPLPVLVSFPEVPVPVAVPGPAVPVPVPTPGTTPPGFPYLAALDPAVP